MRHIKKLLVLFLVFSAITSCEKEEVSYALQDISAPTDVKAIFDISQDEVGLVTLTPTAEGASMFEVYFGDVENETPTMVNPGETLSHTYAEGEYNLRIVAIGLTGLKSELIRVVTVSFDPPTDLEVDVKISSTNPFELLVTPSATNATVYDVYFGDVEDEEPLTIMDTETASHVYAETGTYNVRVVARGGGAASVEYTEEVTISGASEPVKLPITFEDATVNYAVAGFGASDFGSIPAAVIDNPDASGINTSTKVLSVNKLQDAQVWAGASIPLADAIDFSNSTTVAIKVWSPRAGTPILFKIEDSNSERDGNGNPTVFVEIQSSTTLVGTWEEITFDLSTIDSFDVSKSYDTAIVFPDFGTAGKGEMFYFDDIMLVGATADCVAETEENIDFANGPINWTFKTDDADHEFDQFGNLTTDIVANPVTDGINPSCSVQMVEKTEGCETWSGLGQAIPTAIDFTTTDKKIFKLKVLAKDQLAAVTLRLEKEPFPDVDPAEDRVAQITELGVWQELTFDFSDVDDKTFRSIIIYFERDAACDGDVYYFDDLVQTDGGTDGGTDGETTVATSLPIDFESNETLSGVFEAGDGVTGMPISNPDMSGINTSATVYEFTKASGAAWYSGIYQIFPSNINLSSQKSFSIKFWSPKAGINVRFQLEKEGGSGGPTVFKDLTVSEANKWVTLTYNFDGVVNGADAYDKLVIFPDFDSANETPGDGSVYYIDDLMQTTGGTIAKTSLPINFETPQTGGSSEFRVFESDTPPLQVVSNPDPSGINTSSKVAKFTAKQGGADYAGTVTSLSTPFTLSASNSIVKIMVYKTVISDVGIKFESNSASTGEIKIANTKINEWEEITFDMSGKIGEASSTNIDAIVIFPDFDTRTQDNVIYFDNITIGSN